MPKPACAAGIRRPPGNNEPSTAAPLADELEAGGLDRTGLNHTLLLGLQRPTELQVEGRRPGKPALGEAPVQLSPYRRVAVQAGVVCLPLSQEGLEGARRARVGCPAFLEIPAGRRLVEPVAGVLDDDQPALRDEQAVQLRERAGEVGNVMERSARDDVEACRLGQFL